MSPEIQLLPEIIRNQIAAGEVVERPASILKELIENSIDALATHIKIEIKNGGKDMIHIQDNGHGINAKNLEKICVKHATSKIQNTEDLHHIQSYGFRGEALASVSSVAMVTIHSRHENEKTGNTLRIEYGKRFPLTPKIMEHGTHILVSSLFETLPARKKFLKGKSTEYFHCLKVFQDMAITYPHIHFEWKHDTSSPLLFPPHTPEERLSLVFPETEGKLIPIDFTSPHIAIKGYVSKPGHSTNGRDLQRIFVNQRPVQDKTIYAAIKEAYHSYIASKQHPFCFLSLTVPFEQVDVNVHPRKTEIRFTDTQSVFIGVLEGIRQGIQRTSLQTETIKFSTPKTHENHSPLSSPPPFLSSPKSTPISYPNPSSLFTHQHQKPYTPYHTNTPHLSPNISTSNETLLQEALFKKKEHGYRVLGQLHKGFIVCETETGIQLFDQHALHERARYNILMQQLEHKNIPVKHLLLPICAQYNHATISHIESSLENFASMGFFIDILDSTTIQIQAIPTIVDEIMAQEIISGILSEYEQGKKTQSSYEKAMTYIACRSAVMFGDTLSLEEMQGIIDLWTQNNGGLTCPHGRPIGFNMTLQELRKKVGRC